MTTFDERERSYEAKFAHDADLRFKAEARRNRLLGEWAAGLLGLSGDDAKRYALTVVTSDFDHPGEEGGIVGGSARPGIVRDVREHHRARIGGGQRRVERARTLAGRVLEHGHVELAQPEPGLFLVGMKSYGRAPSFLAMTGYEQVRSVVAALGGDLAAADRVELVLPETGVCDGAGAFDAGAEAAMATATGAAESHSYWPPP